MAGIAEEDVDYMENIYERLQRDILEHRKYLKETEAEDVLFSARESEPQPVEVDEVQFHCIENAEAHHTEMYEEVQYTDASPIFRRGETFYFAIRFHRKLSMDTDNVKIELSLGPRDILKKATLVTLHVSSQKKFTKDIFNWDICLSRMDMTIANLQIQIPFNARIGAWRMRIVSQVDGNEKPVQYDCKENIYILFNPWCKDDPVYMEDDVSKEEYVLNDVGKIFAGSYKSITTIPWVFNQFSAPILPACILILEKSGLNYKFRGNPVKVVRAISATLNSEDDAGVLEGRWGGNYEGGTSPWIWTGSTAILEEYLYSGGKTVKYGQCWVFSGLLTTVCRALGIPCRSVTNYESARDSNANLTLDVFFDKDGNVLHDNSELIWAFHVWNDCWMARHDLPEGYGGWQAVDSTPQRRGTEVYQVGPASLQAVRKGEIGYAYDVSNVFSNVNADEIHYQMDNSEVRKLSTYIGTIGRFILTKAAGIDDEYGDSDMKDITMQYKYKEGTPEERMAVWNAAQTAGMEHIFDTIYPEKVDMNFKIRKVEGVMVGQHFQIILAVENESDENRTVEWVLNVCTVHYTGIPGQKVKKQRGTIKLTPRQKKEVGLVVTADEYVDKLVQHCLFKIYAIFSVKETMQTQGEEVRYKLHKPQLKIEVEGELKVNEKCDVTFSFNNPLRRTLHQCLLSLEGPGLAEPQIIPLDDVEPDETMIHVETLVPRKSGKRKLVAVFSCRPLYELVGLKHIDVQDLKA